MKLTCPFCKEPVDTDAVDKVVQRVADGWTPRRSAGGPNVVYKLMHGVQYAHKGCVVEDKPPKVPEGQGTLEGT